jgi:arylsulfatase A-like enzyme
LRNRISPLVELSLALGLAFGFVEALEVVALSLVPGALTWFSGNTAYITWVAPLVYGIAFALIGVLFSILVRVAPRIRWDSGAVFLMLGLSIFLAVSLPGRLASDVHSAIIALGVAAQGTRWYNRHRDRAAWIARRSLPFLAGAALIAAAATVGGGRVLEARARAALPAAVSGVPNVLLLVMDTQRADHLSVYGYGRRTSPRIDRLAGRAAVFTNAYANSAWTLPTHATFFTGRLPFEHRAGLIGRSHLDGRYVTLAEALRDRGYATGAFVANVFWVGRHTGLQRGFSRYEDFYGNAGDAFARTALGRRLSYDVLPFFGFVELPGRKSAADVNRALLSWLDTVGDRPFFAFANYFDVHTPLLPPPPYAGSYSGLSERERRNYAIGIDELQGAEAPPPADSLEALVDLYDESIRYLDSQVGALIDSLEARGILDRTLVIVTSDHGESWGEHGLMFHAHSLYRELTHVPLIVSLPSRIPPGRRGAPVGIDRIPATVASLTGIDSGIFPGASVIRESFANDQAHAVLQLPRRAGRTTSKPATRTALSGLVTADWYYIEPHTEQPELYEISDIRQIRNLAGDRSYADTLTKLKAILNANEKGRQPVTITTLHDQARHAKR